MERASAFYQDSLDRNDTFTLASSCQGDHLATHINGNDHLATHINDGK
jgi:hypothetical protein